jgi:hypothetical protein
VPVNVAALRIPLRSTPWPDPSSRLPVEADRAVEGPVRAPRPEPNDVGMWYEAVFRGARRLPGRPFYGPAKPITLTDAGIGLGGRERAFLCIETLL